MVGFLHLCHSNTACLYHAEAGRTDVESTTKEFIFTSAGKSVTQAFTIVDDDVLEFDELFMARFVFPPEIFNNWNISRESSNTTTFFLIKDDDCELQSDSV